MKLIGVLLCFLTLVVFSRADDSTTLHGPKGRVGKSIGLKIKSFGISEEIIQKMALSTTAVVPDKGTSSNSTEVGTPSAPDKLALLVRNYFVDSGVLFDVEKGHRLAMARNVPFDKEGNPVLFVFTMMVAHNEKALADIRKILLNLDDYVAHQVCLDWKILEAPLGLLDDILDEQVGNGDDPAKRIILDRPEADKVFNALRNAKEVDFKSQPRLIVMDRQPSSITTNKEIIYPTRYQGLGNSKDQNASIVNLALPHFDTVAPDDELPGFREVGININFTPRIEMQYERINLELSPKITELIGYEEFEGETRMPIFYTWSLNVSVTVGNHQTIIFRGPAPLEKRELIVLLQAVYFP